MCEPVTLTTALLVASTALAAGGTAYSASAAHNQGVYQSQVADLNRDAATTAARDAIDRGKQSLQQEYRKQSRLQGAQQVALARSGFDTSFGSALDTLGDTSMIGSEDAQTIAENATREANGYLISASNYQSQSKAAMANAKSSQIAGGLGVASTILGGASSWAGMGGKMPSGGGGGSFSAGTTGGYTAGGMRLLR